MNEKPKPRSVLRELVESHGPSVAEDPRRIAALLRDLANLAGEGRLEISLIQAAAEEGVPSELSARSGGVPQDLQTAQLTERLEHNRGLSPAKARWAVESWAFALGLDAPGLETTHAPAPSQEPQPTPAPAPSPEPQPTQYDTASERVRQLLAEEEASQPTLAPAPSPEPQPTPAPARLPTQYDIASERGRQLLAEEEASEPTPGPAPAPEPQPAPAPASSPEPQPTTPFTRRLPEIILITCIVVGVLLSVMTLSPLPILIIVGVVMITWSISKAL